MEEELRVMDEHDVFELVDETEVPKNKSIMGCQ